MTIEITNTEDFSSKLAFFFAGIQKLERAGIDTDPDYFESMVEDFLVQFEATTPSAAHTFSIGWAITAANMHLVSSEFVGNYYAARSDAQLAITKYIGEKGFGRTSDYEIKEVFYYV